MKLDFYYWGTMCPLNFEMLEYLDTYKDRIDIKLHDISNQPALAAELHMFYPTLTVINDQYRYFAPLRESFLESVSRNILPVERPYLPIVGTKCYKGCILPITEENYALAGNCVGHSDCRSCKHKAAFLKELGLSTFGFMNVSDRQLLGGAEYVPSLCVPYAVPHDEKKAFLTCVYLSDEAYDYKSEPLLALERYLSGNYDSVLVVSDEKGIFPNGDLSFFQKHGYRDLGIIAQENGYCTLHLLEKPLKY